MASAASACATSSVHRFDTVGSTMDEARRLAAAGAPHGTAAVAVVQNAGRGRSGRAWVSPPGNLHVTVVLRPGGSAREAPELGFVIALAVAESVDALLGPGTALKWPNDVLRDGAKLAGILLERLEDGVVLAGIGANVRHVPPDMPYPVTSLAALGSDAGPDALLALVLARLDAGWAAWRAAGFAAVLSRWAERGPGLGTPLQVRLGMGQVAGRFAGLAADGALLLDTAQGRQTFVAGDVLH
jgi:BirA family biotin operon repressor/biotin-[acetyl-CoA-carboxylase] ligase